MPHIRTNRKAQSTPVNPWDHFWKATRARRHYRRLAASRPVTLTNDGIQVCLLLDYFEGKEVKQ